MIERKQRSPETPCFLLGPVKGSPCVQSYNKGSAFLWWKASSRDFFCHLRKPEVSSCHYCEHQAIRLT